MWVPRANAPRAERPPPCAREAVWGWRGRPRNPWCSTRIGGGWRDAVPALAFPPCGAYARDMRSPGLRGHFWLQSICEPILIPPIGICYVLRDRWPAIAPAISSLLRQWRLQRGMVLWRLRNTVFRFGNGGFSGEMDLAGVFARHTSQSGARGSIFLDLLQISRRRSDISR